jgi:tetratricopeptide (TPR) repeat protein
MALWREINELSAAIRQALETLMVAQAAEWARQGNLIHAEAFLRPLAQQPEASPYILDLLAKVLAQQGRFKEAKELWQRASTMQPDNENFLRAITWCEHFQSARQGIPIWQAVLVIFGVVWFTLTITLLLNNRHLRSQLEALQKNILIVSKTPFHASSVIISQTPKLSQKQIDSIVKFLKNDVNLRKFDITVKQDGDVISLIGEVPNLWLRFHAERIVRRLTPQGTRIDISNLHLPDHYEVRQGDSLWKIAQRIYGNPLLWPELAKINEIKSPRLLRDGQKLRLLK